MKENESKDEMINSLQNQLNQIIEENSQNKNNISSMKLYKDGV